MEILLRRYIELLLRESQEIIGEPDFPDDEDGDEKDKEEASTAGGIAGVITPLGTGPDGYVEDRGPGYRSPAAAAGSAFGGAKPYKKKKKT